LELDAWNGESTKGPHLTFFTERAFDTLIHELKDLKWSAKKGSWRGQVNPREKGEKVSPE
jgi:hypothetical protein